MASSPSSDEKLKKVISRGEYLNNCSSSLSMFNGKCRMFIRAILLIFTFLCEFRSMPVTVLTFCLTRVFVFGKD